MTCENGRCRAGTAVLQLFAGIIDADTGSEYIVGVCLIGGSTAEDRRDEPNFT